jgi:hypothetical protein
MTIILSSVQPAHTDATGWLPYARIETPHAVVVVDLTQTAVTVLDPAAVCGPLVVPIDAWLAAWVEMDCAYAIIKR